MKFFHILLLVLCAFGPALAHPSKGDFHALRLKPGQDLKQELSRFLQENAIKACAIVTCVGSLTEANLRFAAVSDGEVVQGPLEIISLVGCGGNGKWHLHLSVSDSTGSLVGGHLLDGSIVRTTAEIVIVELVDASFERVFDPQSGYPELEIRTLKEPD